MSDNILDVTVRVTAFKAPTGTNADRFCVVVEMDDKLIDSRLWSSEFKHEADCPDRKECEEFIRLLANNAGRTVADALYAKMLAMDVKP